MGTVRQRKLTGILASRTGPGKQRRDAVSSVMAVVVVSRTVDVDGANRRHLEIKKTDLRNGAGQQADADQQAG